MTVVSLNVNKGMWTQEEVLKLLNVMKESGIDFELKLTILSNGKMKNFDVEIE